MYESSPVASAVLKSLIFAIESKNQRPDVISASLGGCESGNLRSLGQRGIGLYETAFELAASTGISVVAASGDDGSSTCVDGKGNPTPKLAVSFPASSPFVTAVGGTNIALNAANQITASVVWNDGPSQAAAAGGGSSKLFGEPTYQDAFQTSTRRQIPDVSLMADLAPGYEIYCTAKPQPCGHNGWLFIGGTSAGTPLLAGGVALADQALRQAGQSGLGFVNPLLYSIASSNTALVAPPTAASVFSDVTTGSNDLFGTRGKPLGCCTATPGYDDASGLGQINVANLTAAARTLEPALATVSATAVSPQSIASHKLVATVTCSVACIQSATATIRIAGGPTTTVTAVPSLAAAATAETIKLGIGGSLRSTIERALAGAPQGDRDGCRHGGGWGGQDRAQERTGRGRAQALTCVTASWRAGDRVRGGDRDHGGRSRSVGGRRSRGAGHARRLGAGASATDARPPAQDRHRRPGPVRGRGQ